MVDKHKKNFVNLDSLLEMAEDHIDSNVKEAIADMCHERTWDAILTAFVEKTDFKPL
jgi:hypothetical protein